jgi:hypothetical protein
MLGEEGGNIDKFRTIVRYKIHPLKWVMSNIKFVYGQRLFNRRNKTFSQKLTPIVSRKSQELRAILP